MRIILLVVMFGSLLFSEKTINKPIIMDVGKSRQLEDVLEADNIYYKFIKGFTKDKKGSIYLLTKSPTHVFKIDSENFKLIRTISGEGQGPGELEMPVSMAVVNNKLFVYDFGFRGVKIFDVTDGKCIREFKCATEGLHPNNLNSMAVNAKEEIFIKNINKKHKTGITIYNSEGGVVKNILSISNADPVENLKGFAYCTEFEVMGDDTEDIFVLHRLQATLTKLNRRGEVLWVKDLSYISTPNKNGKAAFSGYNDKRGTQISLRPPLLGFTVSDKQVLISDRWGGLNSYATDSGELIKKYQTSDKSRLGGHLLKYKNLLLTYNRVIELKD